MQHQLDKLTKRWNGLAASVAFIFAVLILAGDAEAVIVLQTKPLHPDVTPVIQSDHIESLEQAGSLDFSDYNPEGSDSRSSVNAFQYYLENSGSTSRGGSPMGALLRSFVVPGWGHHYVDSGNWRRGQYHLGAEVILAASYLGINRHAYVIEKNMYTHAGVFSGVDIRDRPRQFELAVGNFRSLKEYNDYQERTRNLDRLYPDTPENRWDWTTDERRLEYRDLRSRRDNLNQQLPALVAFMVVNRVFSGISAYNRARARSATSAAVHILPGPELKGFEARVSVPF